MTDIFKFWAQIGRGEKIHPADKSVLARIDPEKHGFNTNCLPTSYYGPLRDAPIVLLYLSPGLGEEDIDDAKSESGQDYYLRCWAGRESLPDKGHAGYKWFVSHTKVFSDYKIARNKIAILNIGAYHSKNVKSYASLLALPSSRVSLAWAHEVLFPDAEAGKRIVICMRSASYWGLEIGKQYGESLFVPHVNMAGHLLKNEDRQKLIERVGARIMR